MKGYNRSRCTRSATAINQVLVLIKSCIFGVAFSSSSVFFFFFCCCLFDSLPRTHFDDTLQTQNEIWNERINFTFRFRAHSLKVENENMTQRMKFRLLIFFFRFVSLSLLLCWFFLVSLCSTFAHVPTKKRPKKTIKIRICECICDTNDCRLSTTYTVINVAKRAAQKRSKRHCVCRRHFCGRQIHFSI